MFIISFHLEGSIAKSEETTHEERTLNSLKFYEPKNK